MHLTLRWKLNALFVLAAVAGSTARGALLLSDDFSTYANGNLVGQNGWTQLGAVATLPLQVSGGQVVIPASQSADNQDGWKNLSSVISPPASGTTATFYGMKLTVQNSPAVPGSFASPSYFAAMYTGANAGGFANERLASQDNSANVAGTYVLAARITGQAGDPFTVGTTALSYGTLYNVVVETDMVAGSGNDVLKVFVNPTNSDPSMETPYLTNLIGTGSDPTGIGSFVLSQFASATVGNTGATINSVRVSDSFAEAAGIPEPATIGLFGMSFCWLFKAGRRRRR